MRKYFLTFLALMLLAAMCTACGKTAARLNSKSAAQNSGGSTSAENGGSVTDLNNDNTPEMTTYYTGTADNGGLIDDMGEGMADMAEDAKDAAENMGEDMKSGMSHAKNTAKNKVREMKDDYEHSTEPQMAAAAPKA